MITEKQLKATARLAKKTLELDWQKLPEVLNQIKVLKDGRAVFTNGFSLVIYKSGLIEQSLKIGAKCNKKVDYLKSYPEIDHLLYHDFQLSEMNAKIFKVKDLIKQLKEIEKVGTEYSKYGKKLRTNAFFDNDSIDFSKSVFDKQGYNKQKINVEVVLATLMAMDIVEDTEVTIHAQGGFRNVFKPIQLVSENITALVTPIRY